MVKFFYYILSGIYGFAVLIRNILYDLKLLKSTEFKVPVISIGNITVGGTGKTPHTEYLIKLMKDRFEVASLSRGYKRKSKGFRLVETVSKVEEAGDEPLQLKLKFPKVTVAVCENRVAGIKKLLMGKVIPDVMLLDDAFQHRRITPGINVLLIDFSRPIKNDILLPAGRLREGSSQRYRANIIIITKCPEEITPMTRRVIKMDLNLFPYQDLYFTTFVYGQLLPVFANAKPLDLFFDLHETTALIVTGIANPETMISHISKSAKKAESLEFPDHHYFSAVDVRKISNKFGSLVSENKVIITTEKDAVRFREIQNIPPEIAENLYYLPIRVKFLDNEGKEFDQRILNYVGKNKSNRQLHQREPKK